ncbi:hypothetical protein SAMN04488519_102114 [Algoriphagus ornithinivorans]|uniref:TraB family protein n=1 Tax=Algoriphagus ornithinivorans TaxID=226506 RepID=A0A1I5C0Q3_9BACT|nr:TraB/GumN family protein [Algoriphagus ornithinivorans]SFN80623.1 hypothetical protein SAMN04488519_102114 [Algoriphagus ornithinivorans]
MKKNYCNILRLTLLFCIGFVFQLQAQTEKSLLWKISGNGLEKDSYVFGTIHMICPDQFLMNEEIKGAFTGTEQLVLELDMDDPELQQKMQAVSINSGMKNIQGEMKEEQSKALDQFLTQNYGAGLAQMGILKPFVLTSMVLMKQLPCDQMESYEFFFTQMAQQQGKEILGLEDVAFQVGIFDQIPLNIQLEELGKMVTTDESMKEFQTTVEAYVAQDLDKLYQTISDNPMTGNFSEILLDQRNENWIPVMKKQMEEKSTFFAVGSGHLAGQKGVLNLLKEAGYTLSPVN